MKPPTGPTEPKLDGHVPRAQVVALLAPTLGRENAASLVEGAARTLRLVEGPLSIVDARAILDLLARSEGLPGVAARFARTRATFLRDDDDDATLVGIAPIFARPVESTKEDPLAQLRRSSASIGAETKAPSTPRTLTQRQLASMLASSLGESKANEVVRAVLRRLDLEEPLSADQAASVLEEIAEEPGIVGVTARFAKARLVLK